MLHGLVCLLPFVLHVPTAPAVQVRPVVLEPAWTSPLGTLRETHLVTAGRVGELLLVQDGRHGITALDPSSGAPVWFVQLSGPLDHWPSPGDAALVFGSGTAQVVVDPRTGERLATRHGASVASHAAASDGRLLFVPSLVGDELVVTDLATGLKAWGMGMARPFSTPALVVGSEARRSVVVGTRDGMLRAVPAAVDVPRAERWVTRVGLPVGVPTLHADRLYVAGEDRVLWALSPAAGDVQWKHLPGETLVSGPVALGDVVCIATPTRLLALRAADGQPAWELAGRFVPRGEVAGLLLVGADGGRCQLRDPADGSLKLDGLPPELVAAGAVAVALRGGVDVVAWRRR
jgi:outer membrane protein assembly factor BamB